MEGELPSRRTCLGHPVPQTFGMLTQGKIAVGLRLTSLVPCKRTVCKNNTKAVIMTTGLIMTTRLKIKDIVYN